MITIPGLPKLSGIVIYYGDKKEMETVYKRLKDLKLPEVVVKKSWDQEKDTICPWVIAFIRMDKKNPDELDKYLTENKIDLGKLTHIQVGERGIHAFFTMLPLDNKFEPGIARIAAGECPLNAKSAISCQFCHYGHMLECHWNLTCSQANCSHLVNCDEDAIYRDE